MQHFTEFLIVLSGGVGIEFSGYLQVYLSLIFRETAAFHWRNTTAKIVLTRAPYFHGHQSGRFLLLFSTHFAFYPQRYEGLPRLCTENPHTAGIWNSSCWQCNLCLTPNLFSLASSDITDFPTQNMARNVLITTTKLRKLVHSAVTVELFLCRNRRGAFVSLCLVATAYGPWPRPQASADTVSFSETRAFWC